MTDVPVQLLRAAADLLLTHLEKKGKEYITLDEDFYGDVPAIDRYDLIRSPTKHTVGQLSDDVAELKRLLEGSRPPTCYGLVWLAAVLRRVGETAIG
jgi:hypothetical protein